MIQVVTKFTGFNSARFLLVQVRECFFQSLPLEFYLFQYSLDKVHLRDLVIKNSLVYLLISLSDQFYILLVLGVALRVMPEVETLRLLDLSTHPLAEICIVDLSLFLMIFINYKFSQILEIQVLVFAAKKSQDVINSYITIIVTVQVQESLPHTHPVVRKFVFD